MRSFYCPVCNFQTDASEMASFGECRMCGWDGQSEDGQSEDDDGVE
jgi:rubredoxin